MSQNLLIPHKTLFSTNLRKEKSMTNAKKASLLSEDKLSLGNLADGAVIERFDHVLKDVLANCRDINEVN